MVTDAVHYFYFNSQIIDFHYYCKMHLYILPKNLSIHSSLQYDPLSASFLFSTPNKKDSEFIYVYIYSYLHRSSCLNIIFKTIDLKNFINFTGDLRPATLLKRDSNTGVFLQNLWKFLEHLQCGCFCLQFSYSPLPTYYLFIKLIEYGKYKNQN